MRLSCDTVIQRGEEEIEVNVEYDATPLVAATWLDPPEGGELEITAVFVDGVAIDPPLTDEEYDKLHTYLAENLTDDDFDDGYDEDWRNDD